MTPDRLKILRMECMEAIRNGERWMVIFPSEFMDLLDYKDPVLRAFEEDGIVRKE